MSLMELLKKFDGQTVTKKYGRNIKTDDHCQQMRYRLTKLPEYLILYLERFPKVNEALMIKTKNNTIVDFPVDDFDLGFFV